ncbi:beta-propeller domain-containing protein [Marilutibacter spongiae]|uniref:Beta-propeller domain-containing protein n=1 Tax=Marilutibacter spongiae TaxID=2025720 RepID=A0A7W3TPE1_9GAMM|nr:beta-propeller domain-containing protein [Lysobacter spongiae]MBB1062047.1 beta-propeller domain-containing protein [Lysobacter spongiae]
MLKQLLVAVVVGCGVMAAPAAHSAGRKGLAPFADETAFLAQWQDWRREARAAEEKYRRERARNVPVPVAVPAPLSMSSSEAAATALDTIEVTGSRIEPADLVSITNVQTAGVDEGGIVKANGDFLVVLRRGRLFTVKVGDDRLEPVASIDAFAPGSDPSRTWYDEMLLSGSTVVVVGYSYERGGTEIGLFHLSDEGTLAHRATYHLRASDYYSARNYASRLIGTTLVFYSPVSLYLDEASPLASMPALRRWSPSATSDDFHPILPATRIHRVRGQDLNLTGLHDEVVLHTVSRCELGDGDMHCEAEGVLGPEGRVFYVSQSAIYLWTTPLSADEDAADASTLYRLPLDGSAPTALRTSGAPIDQMSFLEADGMLNVLVGSESGGEGMWASEGSTGTLALLRLGLDRLGDGRRAARPGDYRPLPSAGTTPYDISNRFIGDWLVYGVGPCHGCDPKARRPAHALRPGDARAPFALQVGHAVERIDAMGKDAILVGASGPDLHFTGVRLDAMAAATSAYVHPDSTQGDDRTHGFFYRPTGEATGIVGLPALHFDGEGVGDGASVVFLHNNALRLRGMGTLDAHPDGARVDDCQASCVDWYGNARPIFMGTRIFALMGYEIVEGERVRDRIRERRRTDYFRAPEATSTPPGGATSQ